MYMLSRIADSLFWMHRYMERADGLVRTLRNFYILSFEQDINGFKGYHPLLDCYSNLQEDALNEMALDPHRMLNYLITDSTNTNSVIYLLGMARENARGSQDKITKEVWEQINSMYHYINQPALVVTLNSDNALNVIDHLHTQMLLYNGVVDSTMPRGDGWSFMNTGKYFERCVQTIYITEWYLGNIEFNLDAAVDTSYWRHVLLSLSGWEFYLKNNRTRNHTRQVIDQVVFDVHFTRSVLYALKHICHYVEFMVKANPQPSSVALVKQFARLKNMVEFTDVPNMRGEDLRVLLADVKKHLFECSENLSKLLFSYV